MSTPQEDTFSNNGQEAGHCLYELLCLEKSTLWTFQKEEAQPNPCSPRKRLESLLTDSSNKICADCGSPDPKWVSLGFGVLICIKCSGVHRSLGVHITKVLSVKLDDWTGGQVDALMLMGGNAVANLRFEALIPKNFKKPEPNSTIELRADFIRRKYELQQFLKCDEANSALSTALASQNTSSKNTVSYPSKKHHTKYIPSHSYGFANALRNSWRRKESEHEHKLHKKSNSMAGMVEFIGLIKINFVRGSNLAVRDVLTSDPYVILSLGNQSVKTHVKKNNLNPVWNEKLMLSIPENIPLLYVLVYDKDTFKPDDFMGEAEIDINPLVSAAIACESTSTEGIMQLGKWLATKENTLTKDSIINQENGTVKQEITLKLRNVERGILEIELECLPLTQ